MENKKKYFHCEAKVICFEKNDAVRTSGVEDRDPTEVGYRWNWDEFPENR